jgi:hypothetical protein
MSYVAGRKITRAKEDWEVEPKYPRESLEAGLGVVAEEKRFPACLFLPQSAGYRTAVMAVVVHQMY